VSIRGRATTRRTHQRLSCYAMGEFPCKSPSIRRVSTCLVRRPEADLINQWVVLPTDATGHRHHSSGANEERLRDHCYESRGGRNRKSGSKFKVDKSKTNSQSTTFAIENPHIFFLDSNKDRLRDYAIIADNFTVPSPVLHYAIPFNKRRLQQLINGLFYAFIIWAIIGIRPTPW
jgi:hypothetical protein